jgi:hypothetical protein
MSPDTVVTLDGADAVELAELLAFLHDILGYSPGVLLEARLARLTSGGYTLTELRTDLARFAVLLGGADHLDKDNW